MPYKQKNSPYWYIRVPGPTGRKTRRSSGTTEYREAQALESRLNHEHYNAVTWGIEPGRCFDDLMVGYLKDCEHLKSYPRIKYAVKALYPHFNGRFFNDANPITAKDINDYKRLRMAANIAPATIRKELIVLSTAINHARNEWGWQIDNPVKGRLPNKTPGRINWITHEQADKLIKCAADHLKPIIILALNTGMRRGELLGLEWSRVDFGRRLIYLTPENQKSGGYDAIPLNEGALQALKPLFGLHQSKVFTFNKRPVKDIKNAFNKAKQKAGLDMTFHDLRHTFASWLVQAGVPIREVADLMRHKDINTTMIYAHLAPDSTRAAIAALDHYDDSMLTTRQKQAK